MPHFRWLSPKWLIPALLLLALMIAAACGGSATPAPATAEPPTAEPLSTPEPTEPPAPPTAMIAPSGESFSFPLTPDWVSEGKYQSRYLQLVGRTNPGLWDLHFAGHLTASSVPAAPQFSTLVEYDPVNPTEVIGDLAGSWDVSEDGMVYTFHLRDAQWWDGEPVTAEDIVFSLDRITLPDAIRTRTAALRGFYEYQTATAVDEKTVRVPIKFPTPLFVKNLATEYMKMYPKHATENVSQDEANRPGVLMGSGPWKFKEFQPQVFWEHERNTNYYKPDRPFFDGLRFNIIRDTSRLITALQLGQAETTDLPVIGSYRPEDFYELQKETNGRIRALLIKPGFQLVLILHMNKPPFDDPRMRRALFLAIDRQELADVTFCREPWGCFGSPGTFLPYNPYESPEVLANVPGYRSPKDQDYADAKALMAEAGYPDGIDVELNTSSSPIATRINELWTEQVRNAVNIDFTLETQDTAGTVMRMSQATLHGSTDGTSPLITDPSTFLSQHYLPEIQKNPESWSDPQLEVLMQAQASELDSTKRLETIKEITELLQKGESHFVPLVWGQEGGGMDYRLQNYHVAPTNQFLRRWEHVWWDPDAVCPDPAGCK